MNESGNTIFTLDQILSEALEPFIKQDLESLVSEEWTVQNRDQKLQQLDDYEVDMVNKAIEVLKYLLEPQNDKIPLALFLRRATLLANLDLARALREDAEDGTPGFEAIDLDWVQGKIFSLKDQIKEINEEINSISKPDLSGAEEI
jgi:hypothetical protein